MNTKALLSNTATTYFNPSYHLFVSSELEIQGEVRFFVKETAANKDFRVHKAVQAKLPKASEDCELLRRAQHVLLESRNYASMYRITMGLTIRRPDSSQQPAQLFMEVRGSDLAACLNLWPTTAEEFKTFLLLNHHGGMYLTLAEVEQVVDVYMDKVLGMAVTA